MTTTFVTSITQEAWLAQNAREDKTNDAIKHPKMTIVAEHNKYRFTVPYAPKSVTYDNQAPVYTSVDRYGMEPLEVRSSPAHNQISMDLMLARPDRQHSVEWMMRALRTLANTSLRVVIHLGPFDSGLWRISSLSFSSTERKYGTNEITRATASVTFTRAVDPRQNISPVSNKKHKQPPKSDNPKRHGKRFYNVRKGDTLSAIAVRFYHDSRQWTRIAKANNIRNPKNLRIGQRLVIP